jgi:hypothetical protein
MIIYIYIYMGGLECSKHMLQIFIFIFFSFFMRKSLYFLIVRLDVEPENDYFDQRL